MISAKDLKNVDLAVANSGYVTKDVDKLLNEAANTIEAYQRENKELYHKLEVLASKIEEYRSEEDAIKTALVTAQKMADKIKKESKDAAALLIESSEAEAKQKMDTANTEAEAIVRKARDYSANLINNKTNEANEIISTAQAKANEAINSSKVVAQDILDQAKAISTDLISKSKAEKEAYEILISTIKNDAKSFVENLKKLYSDQLDVLNSSKLDTSSADADSAEKNVEDVHGDVSSLVDEVKEFSSAIPEEINIPEIPHKEFDDSDVKVEKPVFNTPADAEEVEEPQQEELENNIDEVVNNIVENQPTEPPVITTDDEEFEEDEDEPLDPMEAVEAFSQNEITPIEKSAVPEISEDADMENDESLFDEGDQLPFENYFNINREDVHNDKSQTISLIPPEDDEDEDDEPKFKGFFKKKK
ncbi:DivIVA domain-containing protein [Eubacterium coprostanoligenes]|uniref:DivIVA domain-containing protein n=1 Tax=Eubacterium coprostanoligenes TaxID=290054 RepID=UPI0023529158|nr:DivIVA domain-containing protein [Eubacterium coprostanoligenes]MCI6254381.1 DivIVA domain-containing protein [Eubacterium coprostanoligenes]MCI6361603.1 DivIVA domain-containing protein [Eubacterium coprostanoligenes]MCI7265473.1 DivIVA domain-containing protein [Eubacterium coprostanoligenes]MDY4698582.1 DivIVA domain-containing protein [Eubacterium coprostanoligenes]MDY5400548.1 DivIVA domain-containing protein [Eubacterium coprostanoligenes]